MKKSVLENLKPFQMSKSAARVVNGGGRRRAKRDCIRTAKRDGNDFLISICKDVLG